MVGGLGAGTLISGFGQCISCHLVVTWVAETLALLPGVALSLYRLNTRINTDKTRIDRLVSNSRIKRTVGKLWAFMQHVYVCLVLP